jgi:hypothetical protein
VKAVPGKCLKARALKTGRQNHQSDRGCMSIRKRQTRIIFLKEREKMRIKQKSSEKF